MYEFISYLKLTSMFCFCHVCIRKSIILTTIRSCYHLNIGKIVGIYQPLIKVEFQIDVGVEIFILKY